MPLAPSLGAAACRVLCSEIFQGLSLLPFPGLEHSYLSGPSRCPQRARPWRSKRFRQARACAQGTLGVPVACVCGQALLPPVALASKGPWMPHTVAQEQVPGHDLLTMQPWGPCHRSCALSPCGPGLLSWAVVTAAAAARRLQASLRWQSHQCCFFMVIFSSLEPGTSSGGGARLPDFWPQRNP